MLRYLGEREAADRVENAMFAVFKEGKVRTRDIGGTARTAEFADAIIQKIGHGWTPVEDTDLVHQGFDFFSVFRNLVG